MFLFKTEGLVYGINSQSELHGIARMAYGITDCRVSPLPFSLDSILAFGEIPYRNKLWIPYNAPH
jgi:hypothetical protein